MQAIHVSNRNGCRVGCGRCGKIIPRKKVAYKVKGSHGTVSRYLCGKCKEEVEH